MKTYLSALALLLAGSAAMSAAVEIEWVNPEDFTDATYRDMNSEKQREIVLNEVQEYFDELAGNDIPEDYTLSVHVTNIDLEGDFEPGRAPNFDDVRIVRTIYPAAISFTYELRNEAGEVVKQGEEDLRHDMITRQTSPTNLHTYPYTREVLKSWFNKNFRDLRNS